MRSDEDVGKGTSPSVTPPRQAPVLEAYSAFWRHCGRAHAGNACGGGHPERRSHMGERAIIVALTAVVLVTVVLLSIVLMR